MYISQLPPLSEPQPSDLLAVVDVNDPTEAPSGTTKKATLQSVNSLEWVNAVNRHGADPTGTADSTAAILAAIADVASSGGTAYLPNGTYLVSAPPVLPSGVRLRGPDGNVYDTAHHGATLKLSAAWAQGSAPVKAAVIAGTSAGGSEVSVSNLNIDCSASPSVTGIGNGGGTNNVLLENIMVYDATYGVSVGGGNTWRGVRVCAHSCYYGFYGFGSDTDWTDCESIGASGHGWYTVNAINTTLLRCRSEWSALSGFYITGDATATGGLSLVGCSTDRNGQHGVYVASTGTWPLLISGHKARRDGATSASSGYAGVTVANTNTSPVIIDGLTVFPGYNDDGSGIQSPQYGINVNPSGSGSPTFVQAVNAYLHAVSGGVNGTLTSFRAIASRTGNWNASGAITVATDNG